MSVVSPPDDATTRFTERVANYVRYRPGYPPEVLDLLRDEARLSHESIVADVGAGTGIFTQRLLTTGAAVYAVEPNDAMRAQAEALLRDEAGFCAVAGSAEDTTLPDASVDLITAAQAFHWFDLPRARVEFRRILQPGGVVALLWNDRDMHGDPFMAGYEDVLRRFAAEYQEVTYRRLFDQLTGFFGASPAEHTLSTAQRFDREGLRGRFLSSSYAPRDGDPRQPAALEALDQLFDAYAVEGEVAFRYVTRLFLGRLDADAP